MPAAKVRIALHAMGGDHGPAVILPGAELSLGRHPDIELLLYGEPRPTPDTPEVVAEPIGPGVPAFS